MLAVAMLLAFPYVLVPWVTKVVFSQLKQNVLYKVMTDTTVQIYQITSINFNYPNSPLILKFRVADTPHFQATKAEDVYQFLGLN